MFIINKCHVERSEASRKISKCHAERSEASRKISNLFRFFATLRMTIVVIKKSQINYLCLILFKILK